MIIESETLTDQWANQQTVGGEGEKKSSVSKHNGIQHPKTVTVDDKNISEIRAKNNRIRTYYTDCRSWERDSGR